jgi:hypothetical protein
MTRHMVEQRLRVTTLPSGERAAIIESVIPEDGPPELREGLARRALVNQGGDCPCGATIVLPNRARRRAAARAGIPLEIEVRHEVDCPASTRNIVAAAARWAAR